MITGGGQGMPGKGVSRREAGRGRGQRGKHPATSQYSTLNPQPWARMQPTTLNPRPPTLSLSHRLP